MITATSIHELNELYCLDKVVLACGVFDGVHRGHRRILETLLKLAEETGAAPVTVTFDPHPRAVLMPENPPRPLTVREQKLRLLKELGIAATVFLPFSRAMAALDPNAFVETNLLPPDVTVCGICVGAGWRFGSRGSGDTVLLSRIGRHWGFKVNSVSELALYGKPVSSTRIRAAVTEGKLSLARRLLGRPYSVFGHVAHGQGLGETEFHCPTANLMDEQIVLPPCGVYVARGRVFDGDSMLTRDGIVYVGNAPTLRGPAVPSVAPIVELHLFELHQDLYGKAVEVEFLEFLRADQVFRSRAALSRQIQRDIAKAHQILAAEDH